MSRCRFSFIFKLRFGFRFRFRFRCRFRFRFRFRLTFRLTFKFKLKGVFAKNENIKKDSSLWVIHVDVDVDVVY